MKTIICFGLQKEDDIGVVLSIIVPVYQGEEYIENCIKSIEMQMEANIELILVDDGSKDNSWSKIMSYVDRREWIKAIHHENRGVSYTRNEGIKHANGEYIWFVDVDDIIMPDSIGEILNIIYSDNPDIIIFGYRSKLTRKQLNTFDTVPAVESGLYTSNEFKKFFWEFYSKNLFHNIGTKIYKKKIIIENKILFQDKLQIFEDALFCVSAIQNVNNIYVTNKVWYCYNLEINRDSLSRGYKRNYLLGVRCLFAKLIEVIQPNREFYHYYLCALHDVVKNEFRKGSFVFSEFVQYVNFIRHEEQYCEAKKIYYDILEKNIFWTSIEKKDLFSAYIRAWIDVKKSNIVSCTVVNNLFDIMYSLYWLLVKRSKNGKDN